MAKTPLNKDDVETIVTALKTHEASLRRAINSNKFPAATPVYEAALRQLGITFTKITQPD